MPVDVLPDLLTHVVRPERVDLALSATTSDGAIRELVQRWSSEASILDLSPIEAGLIERDRSQPTALGHGIGLRHVRTDSTTEIVMGIGRSIGGLKPVNGAEPIYLLILLATPKMLIREYLAILSVLARQLSNPMRRDQLMAEDDPERFIATLSGHESVRT